MRRPAALGTGAFVAVLTVGASSLATGKVPDAPYVIPAQAHPWQRRQHRWRRRLLGRSEAYSRELSAGSVDDGPEDTVLWRNLSSFNANNTDAPWHGLCASGDMTNETLANLDPLLLWDRMPNADCAPEQTVGRAYDSPQDALTACGTSCGGIIDVGCRGEEFRVCQADITVRNSTFGSCLRRPPAGLDPADATSRAPLQRAFWEAFCARRAMTFRILFPQRRCAAGTVIADAATEGQCADLVRLNPTCGLVFDFQDASPPVCRCQPAGTECAAGTTVHADSDVYILSASPPATTPAPTPAAGTAP